MGCQIKSFGRGTNKSKNKIWWLLYIWEEEKQLTVMANHFLRFANILVFSLAQMFCSMALNTILNIVNKPVQVVTSFQMMKLVGNVFMPWLEVNNNYVILAAGCHASNWSLLMLVSLSCTFPSDEEEAAYSCNYPGSALVGSNIFPYRDNKAHLKPNELTSTYQLCHNNEVKCIWHMTQHFYKNIVNRMKLRFC